MFYFCSETCGKPQLVNIIELYRVFLGEQPTRDSDVVSKVAASKFHHKVSCWKWLSDLNHRPNFPSDRPALDGYRGARLVVAKVSLDAANLLGFRKAGWYATDISPRIK